MVSFAVDAGAYDRFMGRYSVPLARRFAEFGLGNADASRVLDVGCGTGALTAELIQRLGTEAVVAVDPSESFVSAMQARHPGLDVRRDVAERLPFDADSFDGALAQLVVHFMTDPVKGLQEMVRVTRPGGPVAACVWDHAGGTGPLSHFWAAVREMDPDVDDEAALAGAREGHLGQLFRAAGLREIEESALAVDVEHTSFDEWWEPFTLGVGPAGRYVVGLDVDQQAELGQRCRRLLPPAPFVVTARAWAARAVV